MDSLSGRPQAPAEVGGGSDRSMVARSVRPALVLPRNYFVTDTWISLALDFSATGTVTWRMPAS